MGQEVDRFLGFIGEINKTSRKVSKPFLYSFIFMWKNKINKKKKKKNVSHNIWTEKKWVIMQDL